MFMRVTDSCCLDSQIRKTWAVEKKPTKPKLCCHKPSQQDKVEVALKLQSLCTNGDPTANLGSYFQIINVGNSRQTGTDGNPLTL